jgi:hypothetical protein
MRRLFLKWGEMAKLRAFLETFKDKFLFGRSELLENCRVVLLMSRGTRNKARLTTGFFFV